MVDPIRLLALIENELKEAKHGLVDALVGGAPKDYAEYKELSGRIAGLDIALSRVVDFHNRLEQD